MWCNVRQCLNQLLMITVCLTVVSPCCAQSVLTDPGEERFLRQLISRQFYDLAREYCEQQNRRATTTDESARWQRRIGQIYAEQAWLSDAESRDGLLALSVERMTDFLKDQAPSAEQQFLIRIQQAALLSQSVRMAMVVEEGGRLFARKKRDKASLADGGLATNSTTAALSAQQTAWSQSLARSEELLNALEQQLGTLKRELDSRQVLEIRDQLKLQLLETRLLQWRLVMNTDRRRAVTLQQDVDGQLDALARSTRNPIIESVARLKLAEISLCSHDTQGFQLRVRSPRLEHLREQWVVPAFFNVRSALSEQDPSQVERLLQQAAPTSGVQRQHLIWLQLEQRLGDCELAAELENPELITKSRIAFEQQLQQAGRQLAGVFRDAAERTSRRYRLVQEVGVHIADLVETVEVEKQRGNVPAALRLIDRAIVKLPPTRDGPRAALLLRAGELQIAAGQWKDAVTRLQQANDLFAKAGRTSEQATADLLRIFALSRVSQQTQDRTAYLAALNAHLQNFSAEPTADQARRWLLLAVRHTDRAKAAFLAAEIARSTPAPRQKLAAWNDFVDCFEAALQSEQQAAAPFPQRAQLASTLQDQIAQMTQQPDLYAASEMVALLSLQLMLDFQRDVRQNVSLDTFADRSAKIRRLTASPTPLSDEEQQRVLHRLDLLDVIIAARTSALPDQMNAARQRLMQSDVPPVTLVTQLGVHVDPEQERPGDFWLAGIAADLLRSELARHRQSAAPQSTTALIRQLPLVQKFAQAGRRADLLSGWVESLLQRQLTAAQTLQVAGLLDSSVAGDSQLVDEFWKRVVSTQSKGSDLWLTAQLRLAESEIRGGKQDAAAKRLGVVSTLYPEWGNPRRRTKASQLQDSLQQ